MRYNKHGEVDLACVRRFDGDPFGERNDDPDNVYTQLVDALIFHEAADDRDTMSVVRWLIENQPDPRPSWTEK